jgi:uncharacterized membrane protein YdjX (TVP38/TMEM64 family)
VNVSYRPNALQRQRLLVLVLIVVVLTYLGSTAVFRDALYYLLVMAKTAVANHPGQGALLFVLYAALAAMFAFVSSSVLIPFAIYAWGQETAFLLLWTGWLVGGMAAYCIGRFLGRPIVIWLTSAEKVAHYEPKINAKAKFTNVLLFQLAVPSEIPGYVLGLLGYSFWRYLLILAFTELPYAVAATFLGDALIQGQMIRFALVSVGGIFVLAYALRSLYRLLGDSDPQESPAKNGNGSGSSPKS